MDLQNLKKNDPEEYERRRRIILEDLKAKHNITLTTKKTVEHNNATTTNNIDNNDNNTNNKSSDVSSSSPADKSLKTDAIVEKTVVDSKAKKPEEKAAKEAKEKAAKEAEEKAAKEAEEKARQKIEKEIRLKEREDRKAAFIRRMSEEEKLRELEAKTNPMNSNTQQESTDTVILLPLKSVSVEHAEAQKRAADKKFELMEQQILSQNKVIIDMEASRKAAEKKRKERSDRLEANKKQVELQRQRRSERLATESGPSCSSHSPNVAHSQSNYRQSHYKSTIRKNANDQSSDVSLMNTNNVIAFFVFIVILFSIVYMVFM